MSNLDDTRSFPMGFSFYVGPRGLTWLVDAGWDSPRVLDMKTEVHAVPKNAMYFSDVKEYYTTCGMADQNKYIQTSPLVKVEPN